MNKAFINSVITFFASLTVAGEIASVVLIGLLIWSFYSKKKKGSGFLTDVMTFLQNNAVGLALLVAAIAMIGSLTFSEVLKFVPCKLCWYQRICMYPQVLLLGIAFWKNDNGIKKYILPLSLIGLLIAIYHIALQNYPGVLPCSDEVANCALKQFTYFGYVTIPIMSASAFVLIILLMLFVRGKKK